MFIQIARDIIEETSLHRISFQLSQPHIVYLESICDFLELARCYSVAAP